MPDSQIGPPSLNIEQIFFAIYTLITGDAFQAGRWSGFWENFKTFSTVLSLLFLTGLVYSIIRIGQIRADERRLHLERAAAAAAKKGGGEARKNDRWGRVLSHIDSDAQNDWKIAVMEADIILDDLLTERGYIGETVAEKLKQIRGDQMRTLDAAWEAHKVRNRIAHDGASYALTQHDARTAIDNYRKVFEEANYI